MDKFLYFFKFDFFYVIGYSQGYKEFIQCIGEYQDKIKDEGYLVNLGWVSVKFQRNMKLVYLLRIIESDDVLRFYGIINDLF